jgi:hypothetical protein
LKALKAMLLRIIKKICYCSKQLLKYLPQPLFMKLLTELDAVNEFENT